MQEHIFSSGGPDIRQFYFCEGDDGERRPLLRSRYTAHSKMSLGKSELESPAASFTKKEPGALESEVTSLKAGQAFESTGLEEYYKPIASYEGIHRFDPDFKWEPEEERKIVRTVRL
jgi:hypothetical protein